MRAHSDDLATVLTGSFSRRLLADVFYGSERQEQDVELTAWSLDWDLTADVKWSGSATVVHQSVAGESWLPTGTEGVLSPFKTNLLLSVEISAGDFSEVVTLGWVRVTTIRSASDSYMDTDAGRVVVATTIAFDFMSLDENTRRRGFRSPESPASLSSAYAELRRITGMPVAATVDDVPIPSTLTYDTSQGGRLKAVQDLFGLLGGVGVVDPAGQWRCVQNTVGDDPVGELVIGPDGTVTDVGYSVDTDAVYNVVVGTGEDPNRKPLYAEAVASGSLAPTGLYGENTTYYESKTAQTLAQLKAETQAQLDSLIGRQTYEVPVQCVFSPVYELGDALAVVGSDPKVGGRVLKMSLSDSALMNVTLEVRRAL